MLKLNVERQEYLRKTRIRAYSRKDGKLTFERNYMINGTHMELILHLIVLEYINR